MAASKYVRNIRKRIGNDLLILPSVSVIVQNDVHQVLLVRSADTDDWMTIGGQIEAHEPPADAAVRECWEETGLFVKPTRIIGVFGGPEFEMTYPNGDQSVYTSICFAAEIVSGKARPDNDETTDVRWFGKSELVALPMSDLTRSIIAHAFNEDLNAAFRAPTWKPPESAD